MKNLIFIILIFLLFNIDVRGHEPIYGNGPHVLFLGGFAPGITVQSGNGIFETEYSLEYGLTSQLTIGTDVIFSNEEESYSFEGLKLKGKYRFYTEYSRGAMLQFSALGGIKLPNNKNLPKGITFGIAAGREAVEWYWFASAVYIGKTGNSNFLPGDELNYDVTLGYRVNELKYYKPDLVLFIELIGKYQFNSKLNGSEIAESGGHSWGIAPTIMFTFRNYALRSGIEFGLGSSGFLNKPETNFKVAIEMHI